MNGDARKRWERLKRLLATEIVRTIFVWGPPGVGKTWAAYNHGHLDRGVYAVTLTDDTSAAELRGHFVLRGSDTQWHDGVFVGAMRRGARLVINEISHANADVLAQLYPLLESPETASLSLPTGETVTPAAGFRVICTDNNGLEQLPEALQDRFVARVHLLEPPDEALARLRPEFRVLAEAGLSIPDDRRISLRAWLALELLEPLFGLEDACAAIFEDERGAMIHDAIRLGLTRRPKG